MSLLCASCELKFFTGVAVDFLNCVEELRFAAMFFSESMLMLLDDIIGVRVFHSVLYMIYKLGSAVG